MKKNVVILGAGPAGLTAGYEILRRMGSDYTVSIIEQRQCVGGLCRTVNTENFSFDIGGHRFFSNNNNIITWWEHFLQKDSFFDIHRSSHIIFNGQIIPYPIILSLREMKALGVYKMIRISLDYVKVKINPILIKSLEDFYISRFGKELYHTFFESYTEKVCGQHPSNISPEWGYQRVGNLSIAMLLFRNIHKCRRHYSITRSTIDHFYYPEHGAGELWNNVAKEIVRLGGHIITNRSILNIELFDNKIHSVKCNDGHVYPIDFLFSSIPIPDLLSHTSNIPSHEKAYANELSYRNITIVSFLFPFFNISDRLIGTGKLIPDQWLYIQDKERKVSRIQLINNWSKSLIKDNSCVGLSLEYYSSSNDEMSRLKDNDWINLALSDLYGLKFISEGTLPIDHIVYHHDKAYPCYYGGFKNIKALHQYLDTIINLACIGRNGQHHYSNMDHVMESAFRAVNWLAGNTDKKDIWLAN